MSLGLRQVDRHVRLQAVDALRLIGEPARAALPALRRAANVPPVPIGQGPEDYVGMASRYLVAVLDGNYTPDTPVFGTKPRFKLPPPKL